MRTPFLYSLQAALSQWRHNTEKKFYSSYLRSSSNGKNDRDTSSANLHSPSVQVANILVIFNSNINSGSLSLS